MFDLPDAPYIRDAELFGMDDDEEFYWVCPVCGALYPEDVYIQKNGEVIGCSECIRCQDGEEWAVEHMEDESHD